MSAACVWVSLNATHRGDLVCAPSNLHLLHLLSTEFRVTPCKPCRTTSRYDTSEALKPLIAACCPVRFIWGATAVSHTSSPKQSRPQPEVDPNAALPMTLKFDSNFCVFAVSPRSTWPVLSDIAMLQLQQCFTGALLMG